MSGKRKFPGGFFYAPPMDESSAPIHIPVLADEIRQWLAPRPGDTIVDGTLGGGGHTRLLAEAVGAKGE